MGQFKETADHAFTPENTGLPDLIRQHPKGVFIYYDRDSTNHPWLLKTLSANLPDYLICVQNEAPGTYPADCGMQLGKEFYGWINGVDFIKRTIAKQYPDQYFELLRFLPRARTGNLSGLRLYIQEGGLLVPVGGSNIIVNSKNISAYEEELLSSNGLRSVILPELLEAILEFQKVAPKESQWLYFGHADLLLTGFARIADPSDLKFYMDDQFLHFLTANKPYLLEKIKPTPLKHDYVLRGGCNIKYIQSAGRNLALTTTMGDIEPLAADLTGYGHTIVELGVNQFRFEERAGIKCRTLDLTWVF